MMNDDERVCGAFLNGFCGSKVEIPRCDRYHCQCQTLIPETEACHAMDVVPHVLILEAWHLL